MRFARKRLIIEGPNRLLCMRQKFWTSALHELVFTKLWLALERGTHGTFTWKLCGAGAREHIDVLRVCPRQYDLWGPSIISVGSDYPTTTQHDMCVYGICSDNIYIQTQAHSKESRMSKCSRVRHIHFCQQTIITVSFVRFALHTYPKRTGHIKMYTHSADNWYFSPCRINGTSDDVCGGNIQNYASTIRR